jgi:hypothetical protein
MSNTKDKYELLCKSTDDDNILNNDKIMVPFNVKNKENNYNISYSSNSIVTNKIIKIILIAIACILVLIFFSVLIMRALNNYLKKK